MSTIAKITAVRGPHYDLFESKARYLVDPVNAFGVHGKGLARVFAERFPQSVKWYDGHTSTGLQGGDVLVCPREENEKHIIFFVTKSNWRHDSKYEYITQGARATSKHYACRRYR